MLVVAVVVVVVVVVLAGVLVVVVVCGGSGRRGCGWKLGQSRGSCGCSGYHGRKFGKMAEMTLVLLWRRACSSWWSPQPAVASTRRLNKRLVERTANALLRCLHLLRGPERIRGPHDSILQESQTSPPELVVVAVRVLHGCQKPSFQRSRKTKTEVEDLGCVAPHPLAICIVLDAVFPVRASK